MEESPSPSILTKPQMLWFSHLYPRNCLRPRLPPLILQGSLPWALRSSLHSRLISGSGPLVSQPRATSPLIVSDLLSPQGAENFKPKEKGEGQWSSSPPYTLTTETALQHHCAGTWPWKCRLHTSPFPHSADCSYSLIWKDRAGEEMLKLKWGPRGPGSGTEPMKYQGSNESVQRQGGPQNTIFKSFLKQSKAQKRFVIFRKVK